MKVKTFWADSRGNVIVVLVFLWLASLVFQFRAVFVTGVVVAVAASIVLDALFLWLRTRTVVVSLSSIVTGLLIGLIIDPLSGLLSTAVACLLASISKNFIGKWSHKHMFNPAAFGIVVSSFIFSRPVAWWGASGGMAPVGIIAAGMFPVLWKLRRQWLPITFLGVYFAMNLLHGTVESALRLTIDGTVFLFAFVMLPEPITVPLGGAWRWGCGVLVGLLVLTQSILRIAVVDPLLLALLVANLYSFLYKRWL